MNINNNVYIYRAFEKAKSLQAKDSQHIISSKHTIFTSTANVNSEEKLSLSPRHYRSVYICRSDKSLLTY